MLQTYTCSEHTFIPSWIGPDAIVVDLGMNEGRFARAMIDNFGARVVGVEPDASLAEKNRQSGLDCQRLAIGAAVGEAAFLVDQHDSRGSRLITPNDNEQGSLMVPVAPLSVFLEEAGIDRVALLKIDIEGAELNLFESEAAVLDRVDQITVEFHSFAFPEHEPRASAIITMMKRRGFYCLDWTLCQMDVLMVNTRRRPLTWLQRRSLESLKYSRGLKRRMGITA